MSRRATILFVCTGNTCRSPMAEALCNEMLAERGVSDRWVARSAGTAAIPGMPANERAIETLRADGVDVESHRSTPLDEVALSEASLILTMTQSHKDEVLARYPQWKERVFTLGEFVGEPFGIDWEVADPIGGDRKVYDKCRRDLRSALERALNKLLGESPDGTKGESHA